MHVHSLFCSNVVSGVSSPGECSEFKMSISSHVHPYILAFVQALNSELDVQFLLGYYFKVFSRPNFLTFQHFSTHLEIHDNFVCVCRNAIPQKFHQMLWAVKHGFKSDGRRMRN